MKNEAKVEMCGDEYEDIVCALSLGHSGPHCNDPREAVSTVERICKNCHWQRDSRCYFNPPVVGAKGTRRPLVMAIDTCHEFDPKKEEDDEKSNNRVPVREHEVQG